METPSLDCLTCSRLICVVLPLVISFDLPTVLLSGGPHHVDPITGAVSHQAYSHLATFPRTFYRKTHSHTVNLSLFPGRLPPLCHTRPLQPASGLQSFLSLDTDTGRSAFPIPGHGSIFLNVLLGAFFPGWEGVTGLCLQEGGRHLRSIEFLILFRETILSKERLAFAH